MSNERTDEFLKWRGLLDQPDAQPDQVLDDREATWQKLADRLGERRRRRLSGYRIAAACLLFALIIPATHLLRDHHSDAGILPPRQPVRQLPPVSASVVRQSHTPVAAAATTAQSAPPIPRARSLRRLPLLAKIRLSPAPIMAPLPDSASQSPFPRSSLGPLSGMTPALRTKVLKVVHQNEIRGGNMPSPSVGTTSGGPFINILLHPSWQQSVSAPPPTEDPALLKIKLSPSN